MSARARAPFVLVTGGKGGVGKTTVAANLGVELARTGRRVLLVDLDLGLANLDLVLGLDVESTVESALDGELDPRKCIVEGPGGVHVLPAGSGEERMGRLDADRRERLVEIVVELAQCYDVVIGDSAAGIGPEVLGFASIADRVLVVTTPELAALTDAYGLIKAIDQFGSRTASDIPTPEVVVNHASGIEEGEAIARKLRGICERFLARSPRQAGWLPRSPLVERSATQQAPFVLRPRQALEQLCLRQIASRLDRLTARRAPERAAAGVGKSF